jgi:hypothetical protein
VFVVVMHMGELERGSGADRDVYGVGKCVFAEAGAVERDENAAVHGCLLEVAHMHDTPRPRSGL